MRLLVEMRGTFPAQLASKGRLQTLVVNDRIGSGIRAQRAPDSGLECAAEPTLAAVALLHLKRAAAISAVEGHLIERMNGRFGPLVTNAAPSTFRPEGRRAAVRCTCSVKGRLHHCGHWLKSGAIHLEPTLDAERRQCGSFRPSKRTGLSAYIVPTTVIAPFQPGSEFVRLRNVCHRMERRPSILCDLAAKFVLQRCQWRFRLCTLQPQERPTCRSLECRSAARKPKLPRSFVSGVDGSIFCAARR
jgi:hypothetical protein